MPDRRTFLTGLASLAVVRTIPAVAVPTFDAAGYVADLVAVGVRPFAVRDVSLAGVSGRWRHGYHAPDGFGRGWRDVMVRWFDAKEACPDYVEIVGRYIADMPR